ncbi:MAG: DUF169 domain-containing protein [Desulfitobacteriaceae bacterium]|nr:DUF169 domain-containing protein [Desulfitobacteriaceae bacterium]
MESRIAQAIGLKNSSIAVLWTNEKPVEGLHFREGKEGCVGTMLTAAFKGRIAFFDRGTIGCSGGRAGLGFGSISTKNDFPVGGIEYLLSTGNKELYKTEEGRKIAEAMPILAEGEGLSLSRFSRHNLVSVS